MAFQWKRVEAILRLQTRSPRRKTRPNSHSLFLTIGFWVLLATIATLSINSYLRAKTESDISTPTSILASPLSSDLQPPRADQSENASHNRSAPPSRNELLRTSLTAVGGIGAVAYLVIKYRQRSSKEYGEADELLNTAVQQLGSDSPQVRIASVYALAHVADSYGGDYNQRVVDILCGYLRTDRLLKDENGDIRYAEDEGGNPDLSKPLSADGPVESTILKTLTSHLKSTHYDSNSKVTSHHPGPWSSCELDLHGGVFTERNSFSYCHFNRLNLANASITEEWEFIGSNFSGTTIMSGAKFRSDTWFNGAQFQGEAWLNEISFNASTSFQDIRAENMWFNDSFFTRTSFDRAAIRRASFNNAAFDHAWFDGIDMLHATFNKATFTSALFIGGRFKHAAFNHAKIKNVAILGCLFEYASFTAVNANDLRFDGSVFEGPSLFTDMRCARASFDHARFKYVDFTGANIVRTSSTGTTFDQELEAISRQIFANPKEPESPQ